MSGVIISTRIWYFRKLRRKWKGINETGNKRRKINNWEIKFFFFFKYGRWEKKKIERETPDQFNFVDLHIHSKDAEGNTVINYSGATLPKEYFSPVKKELPNGKEINLSQPAIVAYHKLHSNRPYDATDLQRLKPNLRERDFVMLREELEKELEETERIVKEKVQEAWDLISPILEMTHDQTAISEKLYTHPDIEKRRSDPKVSEYISLISQYVSENQGISFDDFLKKSLSLLKPREHIEQKLKILDQLESS